MATAKKADKASKDQVTKADKATAKSSTITGGVKTRVVAESGLPKDTERPEIDESRHPSSGMQELPTGGAPTPEASSNAQQGSGIVPSFIDPQPSIGADHGQRDHQDAPVDTSKLERVTNYAQAASLPVIEKGAQGYSAKPAHQPAPKKAVKGKPGKKGTNGQPDEPDEPDTPGRGRSDHVLQGQGSPHDGRRQDGRWLRGLPRRCQVNRRASADIMGAVFRHCAHFHFNPAGAPRWHAF